MSEVFEDLISTGEYWINAAAIFGLLLAGMIGTILLFRFAIDPIFNDISLEAVEGAMDLDGYDAETKSFNSEFLQRLMQKTANYRLRSSAILLAILDTILFAIYSAIDDSEICRKVFWWILIGSVISVYEVLSREDKNYLLVVSFHQRTDACTVEFRVEVSDERDCWEKGEIYNMPLEEGSKEDMEFKPGDCVVILRYLEGIVRCGYNVIFTPLSEE